MGDFESLANCESLSSPDLLLFDWDNTLVDSFPVILAAMNMTLARFDMGDMSASEQKTAMNSSLRHRFPLLFGERWQEARDLYYGFYDACAIGLKPLAHAESCLRHCAERGIAMGVVSNKRGVLLRAEIAQLGWSDYFSAAVGAGDSDEDKPSALLFAEFLRHARLSAPGCVWMIGDSPVDMEFAHNIGAKAIYLGVPEHGDTALYKLLHGCFSDIGKFKEVL